MGTIDSMKSILTQSASDALCEKFHIPDIVHYELPGPNDRIRNSPTGKIDVYSRFFDFANYWTPISQFLVDIIEYFQINLSQLSVIVAAKANDDEGGCSLFVPFDLLSCYCIRLFSLHVEMDLVAFINHVDPTKGRIGEREVGEGEVLLLQLTRGRGFPLARVNDQENANIQGAGENNVNEGVVMLRWRIKLKRLIMPLKIKGLTLSV
ncbi:hypothetical protein Tco_0621800 [Tanacetum coccineum]